MHTNANLSAAERERIAYLAGDAAAPILFELAEAEQRLDGLENYGLHDGDDAKRMQGELDTAQADLSAAEDRIEAVLQTLDYALDAVRVVLEDEGVKLGKRARQRLADALADVQATKISNEAIYRHVRASLEP